MSSIRPSPNWLLHTLPEAELEALDSRLELVELVRETVLVEAGQSLMQVYLPDGGAISVMVRLSEGQMAEVATIGRDSILGAAAALDGEISLTSAVVVLPGKASVLDAADFRAAADRSVTFRAVVARHEQALLAMAQQSAACNASHSVEARLSRWLLRARDLCGDDTLQPTQDSPAQLIGVQRNAISIVAHALQRAGIIRYSRGYIDIINAGGLIEAACECYADVKAHHRRLLKISY